MPNLKFVVLAAILAAIVPGVTLLNAQGPDWPENSRNGFERTGKFAAFKMKLASMFLGQRKVCRVCVEQGMRCAVHTADPLKCLKKFEYVDSLGRKHDHGFVSQVRIFYCGAGHSWTEETMTGSCWCGWKPDSSLANFLPYEVLEKIYAFKSSKNFTPQRHPWDKTDIISMKP